MKEYEKRTEELLVELAKQDKIKNKKLMTSMWVILITTALFYGGIMILACSILKEGFVLGAIICVSTIVLVIAAFYALKLEVDAGYYECKNCHHRFIPTYKEVLFAPHMSTTRHLKCPKCNKKTWSKKVMTKE